jgi:thioredoxin 1
MIKHVNAQQLEELIATSATPVFCDFWAVWCGPCRMLGPVCEELAEIYDGKAVFAKLDVDGDGCEEAARKYGISSIPNVLAFKNGGVVDNHLGFAPEAVLTAFIEKNL